jgi:hypothetical protein
VVLPALEILNPQVDTPMTKKHRDGVLEDMKKMLKLSESQHFEVHVDDTDGISNPVVFNSLPRQFQSHCD